MLRIAVLMTCFNRKQKTLQCLRSLFNQKGSKKDFCLDVYLVDDGSTDGTSEAVGAEFDNVHLIRGNGQLFWNRGMYTAWEAASEKGYDHYLWVNDDTFLYENAVSILMSASIETNGKAIICGCTESPTQKGKLTYGGGSHKGKTYVSNYPDGFTHPCDIINGNCVLVPRYVYEIVGNLDWRFNHGIGDNDYSLRAKKMGIQSFTAGSFVGHCSIHDTLPKWCLPQIHIIDRIKNLYSPLGSPPDEYFLFERRHFGVVTAFKHYLSAHLRVLAPRLWKANNQ